MKEKPELLECISLGRTKLALAVGEVLEDGTGLGEYRAVVDLDSDDQPDTRVRRSVLRIFA